MTVLLTISTTKNTQNIDKVCNGNMENIHGVSDPETLM